VKGRRVALTVAGESGSGKSEIAGELAKRLEADGLRVLILQQDDYFFYPPKTNHQRRLQDIRNVGLEEVNLALLAEHLRQFKHSPGQVIDKPLVIFEEDRITREKIDPKEYDMVIAEGTYTTLLEDADYRIFIDRDYRMTLEARKERARDPIDEFSERVLEIEHGIISKHKKLAHIVVDKDYNAHRVA
jgi:uridine kinase